MSSLRTVGSALLACASGWSVASLAVGNDVRAAIEGRYAAMESAMEAHDQKRVALLLAPEFESEDADGTIESADQMLRKLDATPVDPRHKDKTTVISVEVHGDSATVLQRYDMSTVEQESRDGPEKKVELVATSTDTWVQSKGVWLLKRTETDELVVKVDGRETVHERRAPRK